MFLILNPGSTNIKISVYKGEDEVYRETLSWEVITRPFVEEFLKKWDDVQKIAIRVVHGGAKFYEPTLVNDDVLATIEELIPLAPLHNPSALRVIRLLQEVTDRPMYAVFDTAFHRTIPHYASLVALPQDICNNLQIQKYGFHGTSHEYVSKSLRTIHATYGKIISCHLGGGSSVCAIHDGKSVDTSMGFSPMSGCISNTRTGDMDADVALYLLKNGYTIEKIEEIRSKKSGLLGISGYSSDMPTIQTDAKSGNASAKLAFDAYIYFLTKYIGAYIAVLGGVDVLSFTAGIGEGSADVREAITNNFSYLGIVLDKVYSVGNYTFSGPTKISSSTSQVDVWVVPADENRAMCKKLLTISC